MLYYKQLIDGLCVLTTGLSCCGQTIADWTAKIPMERPRIYLNDERMTQIESYYATHPLNPHPTTDPIISRIDPIGNALKYRLSGEIQYADIAIEAATNMLDRMYLQIGGHCDECRWDGEEVIVVYDWLHDVMTPAQRQDFRSRLNEITLDYLDFYWGAAEPRFVENNYYWGYFRNGQHFHL